MNRDRPSRLPGLMAGTAAVAFAGGALLGFTAWMAIRAERSFPPLG